jgi:SWI/SNF-related matrix-associated actin-dependent regulator 1 of chromatin subfamily A
MDPLRPRSCALMFVCERDLSYGHRLHPRFSGTPALSRPIELFPQINALLPGLVGPYETFGYRYCAGVKGRFGMEYKGAEMLVQLHLLLKKFVMIRRLKANVLPDLPPKRRCAVMVHVDGLACRDKLSQYRPLLSKLLAGEGTGEEEEGPEPKGRPGSTGLSKSGWLGMFGDTGRAKIPAINEHILETLEIQDKFLVFAHHTCVLDGIEACLAERGVSIIRIDGATGTRERQDKVTLFQNDANVRVAVLSLTAASTGLTLTAANMVIFAELYWTPSLLLQAEDRVHRIGQSREVHITYLIANNSIDEVIWPLLVEKLQVVGHALNGQSSSMKFEDVK